MVSQSEADIQALLSWSLQQGSSLAPPIEIYLDDTSGLSFRAGEDIVSGTELISARYETTLSWLNVIATSSDVIRDGHEFAKEFVEFFSQNDPNVLGHFFLIQQYISVPPGCHHMLTYKKIFTERGVLLVAIYQNSATTE